MRSSLLALLGLMLVACENDFSDGEAQQFADDTQNSRIDIVERIAFDNKRALLDLSKSGSLRSTDSGYTTVPFDLGVLTFQIEEVSANGSGTSLKIKVGNPTTATITSLSIDATWYSKDESGNWEERGSVDDLQLRGTFRPGTWTNTQLSLADIKPDNFDYVYLSDVTAKSITLGTQQ